MVLGTREYCITILFPCLESSLYLDSEAHCSTHGYYYCYIPSLLLAANLVPMADSLLGIAGCTVVGIVEVGFQAVEAGAMAARD